MFDKEILVPTPFEVIRVGVARFRNAELTAEQRACAREAALSIRCGIEWGDRETILAAQRMQHALFGHGPFTPRRVDASSVTFQFLQQLASDIDRELARGGLVVLEGARPLLGIPPEFELTAQRRAPEAEPPPPPRPPRRIADELLTFYEVRFVDEVGQPINRLDVAFDAGGQLHAVTTNAAGIALLDDVTSMSASVSVVSSDALGEILEPRWEKPRPGKAPSGANTHRVAFTGSDIGGIAVKPAVPNTVVITPPLGKLSVQVFDKTGRVSHAHTDYTISGPMSFQGKTDEDGRLLHEEVPPGNYELSLTVKYEEALKLPPRQYKCPVIVLAANESVPQIRLIGAVPHAVMFRVRGLVFDTNKTFILNAAIEAFKRIRDAYRQNNPSELLLVGHTDTTAQANINDPLSLKRAESVEQFLNDDVPAWLKNYSDNKPQKERWGAREDLQMIEAMPGFEKKGPDVDPVLWYQSQHNLKAPAQRKPKAELKTDGKAGPETREQLIHDYMRLDGVSLRNNRDYDITITTHGCGENFPLDETGTGLDQAPTDEKEDQLDRRVELFFFDKDFGIQPPPPGKNSKKGSTEYPEWRKRAEIAEDFEVQGDVVHELRLLDLNLEPVPAETACKVRANGRIFSGTTNDQGVLSFSVPASVNLCRVDWELPSKQGEKSLNLSRTDIELSAADEDGIGRRLSNLGHLQPDLEDQVLAYQVEMGHKQTGLPDDIADEVKLWHDLGAKPGSSVPPDQTLAKKTKQLKPTTAAPTLKVALLNDAPIVKAYKNAVGSLWRIDILRGSHTGVRFLNSGGVPIESNNPTNAVPNDTSLWIDKNPSAKSRDIFFYARVPSKTDADGTRDDHTSLFIVPGTSRVLLQVKVLYFGRGYKGTFGAPASRVHHVFVRLHGSTIAVNSSDLLPGYRMDHNVTVLNVTTDPKKHAGQIVTPDQLFDRLTALIKESPLTHLVFNVHGSPGEGEGGFIRCGHDFEHFEVQKNPRPKGGEKFNIGLSAHNIDIWDRLKGKVKYIWMQSCAVGSDRNLCSAIAQRTGAWVLVPAFYTGRVPRGLPAKHVEYLHDNQPTHIDPSGTGVSFDEFFRTGRQHPFGNLTKAMDFNLVAKGPKI